jgi:hypothetical protein
VTKNTHGVKDVKRERTIYSRKERREEVKKTEEEAFIAGSIGRTRQYHIRVITALKEPADEYERSPHAANISRV